MVGNLRRQNIYLDSATLEKSPSFSCVLLVARLGGAGSQSQRAAAVLILGLASKHSHSSGSGIRLLLPALPALPTQRGSHFILCDGSLVLLTPF